MRKTDYDMRDRVYEEITKYGNNPHTIADKLQCSPMLVVHWLAREYTPSASSLLVLHNGGCDVLYILTGKRYTITGGDTDVRS